MQTALHNESRQIQIGLSNLCIAPRDALRYKPYDYELALAFGDYDCAFGYEWSGVRLPRARAAGEKLAEWGLIPSLHESWREDRLRDLGDAQKQGGRRAVAEMAQLILAFPLLDESYDELGKLQAAAGRKLPIIVHPEGQFLDNKAPRRPRNQCPTGQFRERWYQPTPEWAFARGVPLDSRDIAATTEAIVAEQDRQGLDGIALDLHHLSSIRAGKQFKYPGELAVALAQHKSMREIQLSIRPDFGGKAETLREACAGHLDRTSVGEVLSGIHEALPPEKSALFIIVEVAAAEIIKLGSSNYLEAHAAITSSIRDIFAIKNR